MKNIKMAVAYGVAGGLLTFLFGGWSVAVFAVAVGISMGMSLASRMERRDIKSLLLEALPATLTVTSLPLQPLNLWAARAINSLPTPLSPVISKGCGLLATASM